MGLIRPTSGTASIAGVDVNRTESRSSVGYLPENPSFYDFLTADEYLWFVGKCFSLTGTLLSEKTEEMLRLLDLWDARKRPIRVYSKGMVQRLGLAQTLLHDPDVYILDEPMSGLDPQGRALVKKIILDLKSRGKCIFFSTHITADVETVCDRVGVLYQGELLKVEVVDRLLKEGITGYLVQVKGHDGNVSSAMVTPDQIQKFMNEVAERGDEVRLIEPERRSLEEFFLDVIHNRQNPQFPRTVGRRA
jgi:ABC-2 type transport system ATP-binding protein